MSDNPEVGAPPVAPPPPAYQPPPTFQPAPSAAQSDMGTFLLIGAIGAFTTAGVTAMQLLPMAKWMGRSGAGAMLIAIAVLGLAGLIGMGIGMLGYARKTNVPIAKAAGIMLFILAAFALLPVLAQSARSRTLMKVIMYGSPFISAVVWTLVGQAMLGARSLLGGPAAAIGWVLMATAGIDIVLFVMGVSGGIRSRSMVEIAQTLLYVSIASRMLAIGGVGAMLLQARSLRT